MGEMGQVCGVRSIEGRPEGLHSYGVHLTYPTHLTHLASPDDEVAGRFTIVTVICDGYCFE